MQLHKVIAVKGGFVTRTRFAASAREATTLKESLRQELGLKRSEMGQEPVDVPTTKADLLAYLNAEAKKHDGE